MSDNDTVALLALCAMIAITVSVVARAWFARAKQPVVTGGDTLERRLARVEVALDDVTAELGRMTESHQFLVKALADRAAARELTGGAPR